VIILRQVIWSKLKGIEMFTYTSPYSCRNVIQRGKETKIAGHTSYSEAILTSQQRMSSSKKNDCKTVNEPLSFDT
jgi:hypothetical protein